MENLRQTFKVGDTIDYTPENIKFIVFGIEIVEGEEYLFLYNKKRDDMIRVLYSYYSQDVFKLTKEGKDTGVRSNFCSKCKLKEKSICDGEDLDCPFYRDSYKDDQTYIGDEVLFNGKIHVVLGIYEKTSLYEECLSYQELDYPFNHASVKGFRYSYFDNKEKRIITNKSNKCIYLLREIGGFKGTDEDKAKKITTFKLSRKFYSHVERKDFTVLENNKANYEPKRLDYFINSVEQMCESICPFGLGSEECLNCNVMINKNKKRI